MSNILYYFIRLGNRAGVFLAFQMASIADIQAAMDAIWKARKTPARFPKRMK